MESREFHGLYLTTKETNFSYPAHPRCSWKNSERIPTKCLKETADFLTYPLSRFINVSVELSVFPEKFKITKLKPPFKKSSKPIPDTTGAISFVDLVFKMI